ncbi:hypothetical protein PNEG_02257 [Pneumocystis murina B123]|uniref:Ubiquitin-like domain-containing protein n=1 Tax=Pneumocystis murina (strain B123) TaxID=1069680 RepID=M7NPX2_PNEMU|nr:hypothetical protein PNEG_02257 [Pneumocystis murina B123]EMR09297.1 hypothetical protein PNEG_02257 [Pneumocystis murina B123]
MGCSFSKHPSSYRGFREDFRETRNIYGNLNTRTHIPTCNLCRRNNSLKIPRVCTWVSDHPITMSNLIRRRKEFWETAASYGGSLEIWNTLRLVLETIPESLTTAQTIINTAGIILPTGDLIDGCYDQRGSYYFIPPYIFSEPTNLISENPEQSKNDKLNSIIENEENTKLSESQDSQIKNEHVNEIIVRLSDTSKDILIKIDSKNSIADMKQHVAKIAGIKKPMHFFLLGKMLSDEKSLIDQGWKEGRVVQALILG